MSDFDDDPYESLSLSRRAMMAARPASEPSFGYLDDLNPAQREAVETLDGPVLMLAGAGTGKTKALISRIAHLILTHRAEPWQILAVTFTNKAAREMKQRIGAFLGGDAEGMPWLGTFHAICVKLLRRHAELAGLKSNFTILDTDDQIRLLKQVIAAADMDEKRWPARQLAGIIDGWKNRALTPERVTGAETAAFNNRGSELYAAYQARLRTLNAVDFGDLLLHMVTIFQAHPDVLALYQRRFKYILVDEYQDTNVAQYLWLRLLAQGHRNICCVGDDDQSIYGWRGAEVGNILRFEKDFPGAKVVRLEQNYRSTPHILAAASGLIARNESRLGKTLWTEVEGGEKVRLFSYWDGEEEARAIGEEIEALQRGTRGQPPRGLDDIAILVRASHQMRAFEDRFLSVGLPYRVIGGPRFYERQEIRDAMAYFRLAVSPDDGLAFERVVNTPRRGLGDKAVQVIHQRARDGDLTLFMAARAVVAEKLISGKGLGQLRQFCEMIERWHEAVVAVPMPVFTEDDDGVLIEADTGAPETPGYDHIRLAEQILEESGYTAMWLADKTPEAPGRLENLKELVKALEQFDNLQGFLEHVALIMENESSESGEKVTIMTLHAAKGLEFPAVFLPGWEEGLFPSQRAMDETGQKGLEEERRLGYVGITRAEELCTISFAGNRRVYGQWQSQLPSRFIDELPAAHVEAQSAPGLYAGRQSRGYEGGFGGGGGSRLEARAAQADAYASPGWKRLQASGVQPGGAGASRPRAIRPSASEVPEFAIGERVFHQKFGYGEVIDAEADTLVIEFDKAGTKHVKSAFVRPADKADDVPF